MKARNSWCVHAEMFCECTCLVQSGDTFFTVSCINVKNSLMQDTSFLAELLQETELKIITRSQVWTLKE